MPQELVLLSPEKTVLSFRLAGLVTRVLAHVFDMFVYGVLLLIVFFGLTAFVAGGVVPREAFEPLLQVIAIVGVFCYFILFEGLWNGQTIGKKAVGIRVRAADGTPVTFAAALGRNLLRPADFLPAMYFVGLMAIFTNTKSQRIGDLMAGTIVVHDRPIQPLFQPSPHSFGVHRFEDHIGSLEGMTLEEYIALKRLCDRFPELSPSAQEKFLRELWEPLARRHNVSPIPNVHPIYLAEAVVMKYGRTHGLL